MNQLGVEAEAAVGIFLIPEIKDNKKKLLYALL
jgi:hypothetical protein